MRKDIAIDYDTGELTMKKNTPQFNVDFSWLNEKEDDYYVYGVCTLNHGMTIEQLKNGIGLQIPLNSTYKKVKMSFLIIDNSNNTYPILDTKNNKSTFDLLDAKGNSIYSSQMPTISDKFMFCLTMDNNLVYVSDMYSYDLKIEESLEQNKQHLLMSYAGNLYQHPTTGVGLVEYLNGNVGSSALGEKIKEEFNRDGLYVENATIDSETSEIKISAKEQ